MAVEVIRGVLLLSTKARQTETILQKNTSASSSATSIDECKVSVSAVVLLAGTSSNLTTRSRATDEDSRLAIESTTLNSFQRVADSQEKTSAVGDHDRQPKPSLLVC